MVDQPDLIQNWVNRFANPVIQVNGAGTHVADQREIAMAFQTLAEPRSFYLLADKWDRVRLMQAADWHVQVQAYDTVPQPAIFTLSHNLAKKMG